MAHNIQNVTIRRNWALKGKWSAGHTMAVSVHVYPAVLPSIACSVTQMNSLLPVQRLTLHGAGYREC